MLKLKTTAFGSLVAVALALAPFSSAFADQRFHGGHWGHGGYVHGWGVWPVFGVAAAVVGTAAAIVTAPFQILAQAASAPYYYPPRGYAAAPMAYNNAPAAYYPAPTAQINYNAPSAPTYYGPAARAYYRPATPAYYNPRQMYEASAPAQYGVPPDYYEQQARAPAYDYRR